MPQTTLTQDQLDGIVFVGQTLGPLFSEDPAKGDAAPLYEALAQMDPQAAAREWPYADPQEAERALRLMQDGIAGGMDAVVDEYRRLFVGPAPKVAPPWGSVYTDRDGVIFGKSALDLHDWLSANNVLVNVHDNMPDDHIGRMLSLTAWLARNRPELLRPYLSEHLLTWAPHFLERVADRTENPFFEGLALLTQTCLAGMRDGLSLSVVTPRFFR